VSQSAQWGPFNAGYRWFNTTDNIIINDPQITALNRYLGSAFQQATSAVTTTNTEAYELTGGLYATYGFEYKPGFDDAYITWMSNELPAWTLRSGGLAADTRVEIGPRPIPLEPMYIIVNLGMSPGFGDIDFLHLTLPATMKVDWIRVYQLPNEKNIGCDPPDFPTAAYINRYIEAYTNPNLTTWVDDYKQPWPKNNLVDNC
jgi:beta-glucanase (GH16 family)